MQINEYNIILITLDGLRRDRIDISPSLKNVKENSIFFSNMITAAPYTLASLHAIFSGMYPSKNGVNGYFKMSKFKNSDIVTINSLLQKKGYYTCCDILHDKIIPNQGFDDRNVLDENNVNFIERHTKFIRDSQKKGKFFLFLHYTGHHKHLVDELNKIKVGEINSNSYKKNQYEDDEFFKSRERNEKLYDSYMPELERYVYSIQKTIKDTGLDRNTIIIYHSDHGTSVGEKIGERAYGSFCYDYTIRVFAMIHIPNFPPKIIEKQCSTIDLYPTIAYLAGIPDKNFEHKVQGKNLFQLINDEKEDRITFSETGGLYGPWPSPIKHNVFCIRTKNKKLIFNDAPNTWEFYDVENDPEEIHNLYQKNSHEIAMLTHKLIQHFKENDISTKLTTN